MEIQIKDLNYLYPTLDDPKFNQKISSKKEFYDTKWDDKIHDIKKRGNVICHEKDFELSPSQMFVRNFLSFQTPYNNLLLYHGLGTGKTCSAIVVTEEMRKYLKEMGIGKRIIIVASPNVQQNFRLQLFDERKLQKINNLWNIKACTGNSFIKEINPMSMKGFRKTRIIKQINRIINISYIFMGYIEFSNYIQKKMRSESVKKEFSNRLIVIDEVQNIRSTSDNKQKKIGNSLLKLVKKTENLKLLLLSATPMFNSCKEIIWLLNLMNLNDNRVAIKINEVFDKNGNFINEEGKELLIRKSRGYISFVRGENPYTFPYRIYPSLFTPRSIKNYEYPKTQINNAPILEKIKFLDIVMTDISPFQKQKYLKVVESIKQKFPTFEKMENGLGYTVLEAPLQTLNISFPVEKIYGNGGLQEVMKFNLVAKTNFLYKNDILKENGRIFHLDNLGKYSGKMKLIGSMILKSSGIIMIYSQYIGGGCIPLALMLEEMGFKRYGRDNLFKRGEIKDSLNPNTMKPRTSSDEPIAAYAMITGDSFLSPNPKKEILECTNPNNINGEKVRVLIISKAASEGLDFKNIRQIHILEPWYNLNRIEQIIGRGVRYCSHVGLPFEKRNVEIYLYGSDLKEIESVDLYIYRLAEKKAINIGKVSRILKENAIDCLLNRGQVDLSTKRINQTIKLELSSGVEIMFEPGDKSNSILCDYMQECVYQCNPKDFLPINEDTYDSTFILMNLEKMMRIIRNLMKENIIYRKDHLIMAINRVKHHPLVQIYAALDQLIKDENEFIEDPLGRLGNLINIADYYIFKPIEYDTNKDSYYERSVPVSIKINKLQILERKHISEVSNLNDIIQTMKTKYTITQTPKRINKGKGDWYIYASLAKERLNIDDNDFFNIILDHILDFDNENHRELIKYIYGKSELTPFEVYIKSYFDKFRKNNTIYFFENNATNILIYEDNKIRQPTPLENEEKHNWKVTKLISNMVGFLDIKKGKTFFKIKENNVARSSGAICNNILKRRVLPLLNRTIKGNTVLIEEYTQKNIYQQFPHETKRMIINVGQLCCELEIILRHYDKIKEKGNRWFLNLIESK